METETKPRTALDAARDLAAALGSGWHLNQPGDAENTWCIDVVRNADGLRLCVSSQYNDRDKFRISASEPRGWSHSDVYDANARRIERPSIGVSKSKDGAALASDVRRRLLGDAEVWWKARSEREDRANAYKEAQRRTAQALAEARGTPLSEDEAKHETVRLGDLTGDRLYGTAQVSGDSVTLELRGVPTPLAVRIIRLIKKG